MLGSCCLLGACGSKFTAAEATGGESGGPGQGGSSSAGAGGRAAQAGSDSGGEAGESFAGDAGAEAGGAAATGGTSSDEGGAGSGGVPVIGHGGSSGNAGTAGATEQPMIPQLGLVLWLRADLGVQQVAGVVQTWLDQSGNQMDGVQTGSNARPLYVAKGLNDLPTLQFDGEGDFLNLPKAAFGDFRKGLAGFMVAQPAASDCASVVEFSNGSEIDDIALGMWQNKWTYEVFDQLIHEGNVDLLAPTLYAVNHRPGALLMNANADLRINRALLHTMDLPLPAVPASNVRENNFVGHTLYGDCNYFKGTVSEIIVYERSLTVNEVKTVESYLAQHWDLGPATP